MDYAIQKAVELGVTEITPLFSERCDVKLNEERAQKKWQHWQNIVISACEQCQQNYLPTVHPATSLAKWSENLQEGLRCLFHPKDAKSFNELANDDSGSGSAPSNIIIAVGPEGGFSDLELSELKGRGFNAIRLGPRILRTETAPVVALSLIQSLWGDF